jgi:hypothetical protein
VSRALRYTFFMKALVLTKFGGPEGLEVQQMPEPAAA